MSQPINRHLLNLRPEPSRGPEPQVPPPQAPPPPSEINLASPQGSESAITESAPAPQGWNAEHGELGVSAHDFSYSPELSPEVAEDERQAWERLRGEQPEARKPEPQPEPEPPRLETPAPPVTAPQPTLAQPAIGPRVGFVPFTGGASEPPMPPPLETAWNEPEESHIRWHLSVGWIILLSLLVGGFAGYGAIKSRILGEQMKTGLEALEEKVGTQITQVTQQVVGVREQTQSFEPTVIQDSTPSGGDVSGVYSSLQLAEGSVTTVEIADGTIRNIDVAQGAAIAYAKLSLIGQILNSDLAGAIQDAKLSQISSANKVHGSSIVPGTIDVALTANVALLDRSNQSWSGRNLFQSAVGIGTASPTGSTRLEVKGHVAGENLITSHGLIAVVNPGDVAVGNGIRFIKDASGTVQWSIGGSNSGGGLTNDLHFASLTGSGWNDRLTLTSTGQLLLPAANSQATALTLGGDTNLYRSAADTLSTDDTFSLRVGGTTVTRLKPTGQVETFYGGQSAFLGYSGSGALLGFGTVDQVYDTNLYRAGVGSLKTDGDLQVAGSAGIFLQGGTSALIARSASATNTPIIATKAAADLGDRFRLDAGGALSWGGGGGTLDTNLYRSAADTLKTDDSFIIQTAQNAAGALKVQNQDGGVLFNADTTNSQLTVTHIASTGVISGQNGAASVQLKSQLASATGLTMSGNEITDTKRSTNTQGDGRAAPDSSTGIWEATTNLVANGGFESNTTGWSAYQSGSVSRSTVKSKFGSASLAVTNGGGQTDGAAFSTSSQSAGTYTWSAWVWAPAGAVLKLNDNGFGINNATEFTGNGNWQRVTITDTTTGAAALTVRFYTSYLQAVTFYVDGVQIEQQPLATPYVETNGGTATRAAARVQAPSSLLDKNQGWIATRVRLGFDYNAEPDTDPAFFEWYDNNTTRLWGYYNPSSDSFRLEGDGSANSSVQTFAKNDVKTIIVAWTSTQLKISVDGNVFATGPRSSAPAITASLFDIGSRPATGGGFSDSDYLWFASGTGTLTDADAATINRFGNGDPKLSSFAASASPTMAWDGVNANYEGSDAVARSTLILDDVSIFRSASNQLQANASTFTLQGPGGTPINARLLSQDSAGNTGARLTWNLDTANNRDSLTSSGWQIRMGAGGTDALDIQRVASTASQGTAPSTLLSLDGAAMTITLGSASPTPVILVLGIKNTAGDPATCTVGSVYYNSVSNQAKVCLSGNKWGSINGAFVTTLPASANDGDEVYYQANAANGTVWHLRYNAGSASAYKWEYLGGTPIISGNASTAGPLTTGYVTYAGAEITLPRAGDYEGEIYHSISGGTGDIYARVGLSSGTGTFTANGASGIRATAGTASILTYNGTGRWSLTGASAAAVIALQAHANPAAGSSINEGRIFLRPIRVN